ncbi:hypothetical protein GCM10018962_83910 [Dactylosporangium matsuzakiense]|uniref:Uncharacterized protein n=1 Tax=Dactylosporangium matsuzakiense TaxID=53360 RepID=A0A9W6NIX9_9ACTN|nr:hypothetical protein GCM10017581_002080 [Dactylosporangium matsuzakiense]
MIENDEQPASAINNPFSSVAVASIPTGEHAAITVPTAAVRDISAYLTDHLAGARAGAPGTTLAILGGAGYGKTHALAHLLTRARQEHRPGVQAVYLDARAATFTAVCRSFLTQIGPGDVRRRLHTLVGADPQAGPETLLRRIAVTTDRSALAVALAMLLRPEREAVAWSWWAGELSSAEAAEHGLPTGTDPQALAMDAASLVAWLYGHSGDHLVVALDDVDRLLTASNRAAETTAELWAQLVESFTAGGAFLAVTGPPELLAQMDERSRQRFGLTLSLPPLHGADIAWFIQQSQHRALGLDTLAPFTPEVAAYLADVTGGVPRRVIRMCFHLYRTAVRAGTRVDYAMVRSVLHEHFDGPAVPSAQAAVARLLGEGGHDYHRCYLIPANGVATPVDFWVSFLDGTERAAGCAVLITESVLKPEAVDDLARRLADIRLAVPDSEAILVVAGHLAPELAAPLAALLATDPILFEPPAFAEEFAEAVTSAIRRLERSVGADAGTAAVDRLHRQQAHLQRMMQQMTDQLDTVHTLVDTELSLVQRAVGPGPAASTVMAGPPGPPGLRPSLLPTRVQEVFLDALDALSGLWRFDVLLGQTFGSTPAPADPRDAGVVHWLLRPGNAAPALATSALLQRLIEAFRTAVEEWYRRRAEHPGSAPERELDRICGVYDTAAGLLPLFELGSLTAFGALASPAAAEPGGRGLFDGLGARVNQAVRAYG